MQRRVFFPALIGMVLIFIGLEVFSQDFEVAPTRLDFNAEPGENQTKVLNVRNHSNRKTAFVVSISDFLPSSDGQKQTMPPATTRRSAANMLNVNPSFFELNPGEMMPVQVTVLVPGDEYGAVWATLQVQPTTEQTSWDADKSLAAGVTVSGRIGISVYQSPSSNANHSLKVTRLAETTTATDVNRTFVATIDNLGDKVTSCKVFLIASNISTSEEVEFPSVTVETYPKMTREVKLELPKDAVPAGSYALAVIVDYGAKYTLEGAQIIIDVE